MAKVLAHKTCRFKLVQRWDGILCLLRIAASYLDRRIPRERVAQLVGTQNLTEGATLSLQYGRQPDWQRDL